MLICDYLGAFVVRPSHFKPFALMIHLTSATALCRQKPPFLVLRVDQGKAKDVIFFPCGTLLLQFLGLLSGAGMISQVKVLERA